MFSTFQTFLNSILKKKSIVNLTLREADFFFNQIFTKKKIKKKIYKFTKIYLFSDTGNVLASFILFIVRIYNRWTIK